MQQTFVISLLPRITQSKETKSSEEALERSTVKKEYQEGLAERRRKEELVSGIGGTCVGGIGGGVVANLHTDAGRHRCGAWSTLYRFFKLGSSAIFLYSCCWLVGGEQEKAAKKADVEARKAAILEARDLK